MKPPCLQITCRGAPCGYPKIYASSKIDYRTIKTAELFEVRNVGYG
jgi:hypothetical protein